MTSIDVHATISEAYRVIDALASCWWGSNQRIDLLRGIASHCQTKIDDIKSEQIDAIMRHNTRNAGDSPK